MLNKLQKILIIAGFITMINPNFCNAYDFWPDDFWSDADSSVSSNFLSWDLGLDLYKKMDKWYTSLQFKLYENELKWGEVDWTLAELINHNLEMAWEWLCIEDTITVEDLINISENKVIDINKIKEECKNKDNSISIQKLQLIQSIIKEVNFIAKEKANIKAKKMYDIARIWLYSDWDTDNSPFDLVDDLKKIDEIIFTREIPYNWVNMNDSDSSLSDLLSWEDNSLPKEISNWTSNNLSEPYISWWEQPDLAEILWTNNPNNSNLICQTNDSWLSADSLDFSWFSTWDLNWCSAEWKKWINPCCEWYNLSTVNWQKYCIDNSKWSTIKCLYKKTEQEWYYYMDWVKPWELIDKVNCSNFDFEQSSDFWAWAWWGIWSWSDWPCDTFFCISIEFLTSQHSLLWGWTTKSIESIIARSNVHLKKNTSTSMVQAKMTTNNLEIMLRDLDLAEKFNIWVNLSWKSPPILNLQKSERDSPEKIKKYIEDMLDIAYKENWLDYERANDLQIFSKVEEVYYCINNKWELYLSRVTKEWEGCEIRRPNIDEDWNYIKKFVPEKQITNAMVDSQLQWLTSSKFYDQYIQVNSFIDYLAYGYSPAVQTYIKWMFNDIPVGWD